MARLVMLFHNLTLGFWAFRIKIENIVFIAQVFT